MAPFGFRHIKHLRRYRQIGNVLARHGFGFVVDQLGLPVIRRKKRLAAQRSAPERLRAALEELGPTYVKLGQLLSTRPDLVPAAVIKELEKLQDNVSPVEPEGVVRVMREDGLETDRVFSYFEVQPVASASIGQVHRARLINGEEVAVKVQRPGIRQLITTDLEILRELASMAERRTKWGQLYQVVDIVNEFSEALAAELDFEQEGRNAERFRQNFRDNPSVVIPRVIWALTSGRVLVMEYVSGIKVSDFEALQEQGNDLEGVARTIIDAAFRQVYDYGFFHADPHPGNIAIDAGNRIIFFDFGQVGSIDDILKEKGMDIILAMIRYDAGGVTRALLDIGIASRHVNRKAFNRDVARLQRKYYGISLSSINLGEAMAELIQLSFKYQVRVPPGMALIVKMMMTLEGLIAQMAPGLSIVEIAEPFGRRLMLKRYSPSRIREKMREAYFEYTAIARNIPQEIESILELMEDGQFQMRVETTNLKELSAKADLMSNRLSLAIVIASLVIGTSLVIDRAGRGFMAGIPLVEAGFGLAVLLGLFLVCSILRSGRY